MKEGCQTPKILEAGNRLITQLSYRHVLPFKKNKIQLQKQRLCPRGYSHRWKGWNCGHRRWRNRPGGQRLQIHRGLFPGLETQGNMPCSIIAWDQRPLSSFHVLPLGMGIFISIILCLAHHFILWTDHFFSGFTGCQLERDFCLGMDHTQSLIYSWFRGFRWWHLRLLIWWYLSEIFGLELML